MNGVDDDRRHCWGRRCGAVESYKNLGTYDHPRYAGRTYQGHWYCDACWAVLKGELDIKKLKAENDRLHKLLKALGHHEGADQQGGFIRRLLCRIGVHKWCYDYEPDGHHRRRCLGCGRRQHLTYDMAYGGRYWGEGWL